jgi:hypothetical protein
MGSIWSMIKGIFGGSESTPESSNTVERLCFACGKMTAGTLGPEESAQSEQQAKNFVCGECGKPTRVLE